MIRIKTILLFAVLAAQAFSYTDTIKTYFDNGQIESAIPYYNDLREGLAQFYYPGGTLKKEVTYYAGRIEGAVRIYSEAGKLTEMFVIENGRRNGPTDYFDTAGVYIESVIFQDGAQVYKNALEDVFNQKSDPGITDITKKIEDTKPAEEKPDSWNPVHDTKPVPPVVTKKQVPLEDDPAYYTTVDSAAVPRDGMEEFYSRIVYPKNALDEDIQGTVRIKVFVDKKGIVTNTELIEGIGYGCDEIALMTVKYTRFTPAILAGVPVNSQLVFDVVFSIP